MFTIRRATHADIDGIAHVHVDTWRTAYAGIMPEDKLSNLSYERSAKQWEQNLKSTQSYTSVADHNKVVGFVSCGPERNQVSQYDCEIYALYVLATYQGRGIGRQLVVSAARELQDRGFETMLIWVLEDNTSARRFYERLGGELIKERLYYAIGDVRLAEVGYGYSLDQLLTMSTTRSHDS